MSFFRAHVRSRPVVTADPACRKGGGMSSIHFTQSTILTPEAPAEYAAVILDSIASTDA
jgi:hypothetical protein